MIPLLKPRRADAALQSTQGRDYQELWFAIAQLQWRSLALLSVDPGYSVANVTSALGEIGTRLREAPVTAVVTGLLDYSSASSLAARLTALRQPKPDAVSPVARILVGLESLAVNPLGTAVAQAADATILCVEMGRSLDADVRRTIELVGRERVIGTVLLR